MATKLLNYTATEINQRLNLAGTSVLPSDLTNYCTKSDNDDNSLVGNTNASALESKINAFISCINSLVDKVVFYTGTPFVLPQELNSQLNLSRYSYSGTATNTALLGSAICGQAICGNN